MGWIICRNFAVRVKIVRTEADFDRACEAAYERAKFMVSEDGHPYDNRFSRNGFTLNVDFVGYTHTASMSGHEIVYRFKAYLEQDKQYDQDDEDEDDADDTDFYMQDYVTHH